jgi:hypothetical protein
MRTILIVGALLISGAASAQLAVRPGQDLPLAPGYVAPSPQAAPNTDGSTGRAAEPLPEASGRSPAVSKKMGAEMESAGDPRAAPDQE